MDVNRKCRLLLSIHIGGACGQYQMWPRAPPTGLRWHWMNVVITCFCSYPSQPWRHGCSLCDSLVSVGRANIAAHLHVKVCKRQFFFYRVTLNSVTINLVLSSSAGLVFSFPVLQFSLISRSFESELACFSVVVFLVSVSVLFFFYQNVGGISQRE